MTALYVEYGLAGLVLLLTALAVAERRASPVRAAIPLRTGATRLRADGARDQASN